MQKHSKKREAIFNCIRSADSHPSAEWIYEKLKGEIPDLSLATVYRNIALFKKNGLVVTVANINGQERIDGDITEHEHFVCDQCNRIIDISIDTEKIKSDFNLLEKYGFKAEGYSLILHGRCDQCIENN